MKENIDMFTDAQGGGRPGRTCGQKAQIINNVISHAIRHNIKLALLSFDVVKAYDKTQLLEDPHHFLMIMDLNKVIQAVLLRTMILWNS